MVSWCPSCPTAEQVRCLVLGDDFWSNLAVAVFPFVVLGAISFVAHGGARREAP